MRVLYLVPHVPNPTKTRSWNHLIGLQRAGCAITVATIARSDDDKQRIQALEESGIRVLTATLTRSELARNAAMALLHHEPLQARLLWCGKLMQQIEAAAREVDIVHVEHLRMARYGLQLKARQPVVWDAVDSLSLLYEQTRRLSVSRVWRWLAAVELPRVRRYERWLTGQFPATLVISTYDLDYFRRDNPYAARISAVTQGLPRSEPRHEPRADNLLVMTGVLDYHPNVASARFLAHEIIPLVQRQHPDVKVQLVGARPVAAVKALASPSIEITGSVPDIHGYLRRASVALAPVVYGAGIQNKLLDAFLTETSMVATSIAVHGFAIAHGEQALIADTPQEFADAIHRLLIDPALRQRIGENGRRYLERHHRVEDTTEQLLGVYRAAIMGWRG